VATSPLTGVVFTLIEGIVPTELLDGVTGTLNTLFVPFVIGFGLVQVTTCKLIVQLQPLLVNGADGGVIPLGMVIVVVIGPLAGAVPILLTVTGIFEVIPAVNVGIGPTAVIKSGAGAADTGIVAVALPVLLFVTTSPETGEVEAVNCGVVPIAVFVGVTGTLNAELVPLFIGPAFVQVTFCPAVVQLHPLLVKGADGGVIPVGIVSVVEIEPVVAALPILLTVTGILEVTPAVSVGIEPTVVVMSGAGAAVTGVLAVALPALLFVTVSPETGDVVAVN
jgi:hypothetical protein